MGQNSNRRWRRKDYLNDFQMNVAGEYVYTGKIVHWESPRKPALLRLWALASAAGLASVTGGCLADTGMTGAAWVLLPYVLSLMGVAMVLWTLGKLTGAGNDIRYYLYQQTVEKLPGRCMFGAVTAGISVLGAFVNLFLPSFEGTMVGGIILILLQMMVGGFCVLFRGFFQRLNWTK